jgi:hypothetical protein
MFQNQAYSFSKIFRVEDPIVPAFSKKSHRTNGFSENNGQRSDSLIKGYLSGS